MTNNDNFNTQDAFNDIPDYVEGFMRWALEFTYWLGAYQMKSNIDQERKIEARFLYPDYRKFVFTWYYYYGGFYLTIRDPNDIDYLLKADGSATYQLYSRGSFLEHDHYKLQLIVAAIEEAIKRMFDRMGQANSYRYCSHPGCETDHPLLVRPFGDGWLCEKCINRLSLDEPSEPEPDENTKAKQAERAKMKPSLRFSILERDNYTCRACGASTSDDPTVKLEVDHIIAIANGGKTKPDNLIILCQTCNRGKGTKSVKKFEKNAQRRRKKI